MKPNKYCCRIYPVILIVIAFVFALAIWFFDEGNSSLTSIFNKNEIFNFLGTVLFIAVFPIGIFYLATERKRFENHAKKIALIGFLPTLIFLLVTAL
jgi:hypothetical protein